MEIGLYHILAIQVVAIAMIYYRVTSMDMASVTPSQFLPSWIASSNCGLLNKNEYTLFSQRVVTPDGMVPAAVYVVDGKVRAVVEGAAPPVPDHPVINYGSLIISPGLVDLHSHLNEPGRADWEGMYTGSLGAAAGGFTTLVDMPLNSQPTTCDVPAFQAKLAATAGKMHVDVAFWGGLVQENAADPDTLRALLAAGVLGLKAFMCPSGMDDFSHANATVLAMGLKVLSEFGSPPLMVHAEQVPDAPPPPPQGDPRAHATYLATRPRTFEKDAVATLLGVARAARAAGQRPKVHVAHLSDADCLPALDEAKAEGLDLTVETCPHYLAFSAEMVPDGDTRFKCAPPIRERENQDRLYDALAGGGVDTVGTDHSPAPEGVKEMGSGNFLKAWGGISGLQFGLPATWTGARERGMSPDVVARWLSSTPAKIAGLAAKGGIAVGKDADFVVWDPEALADTSKASYRHQVKLSPYMDMPLYGRVEATYVRGQRVFEGGASAPRPCGSPILRKD